MERREVHQESTIFGAFIEDLKARSQSRHGELWLQDIQKDTPEDLWDEVVTGPLTRERVLQLAGHLTNAISVELGHSSDSERYRLTKSRGREFMLDLQLLALEYNIEITEEDIDKPFSALEHLSRAGLVDIAADQCVTLTDFGEAVVKATIGPTGPELN